VNTFSAVTLSREDFLTWMTGNHEIAPDQHQTTSKPSHEEGTITLLWDKSKLSDGRQPLIVVPADKLRDFFAFVGTYITTYRPFSAFFRVVSSEVIPVLEQLEQPDRDVVERIARVVAGSAISEVYVSSGARLPGDKAHLSTLTATLSASLGQAIIAGYPSTSFDWIAKQWQGVHHRLDDIGSERVGAEQITLIWRLLFDALRNRRSEAVVPLSGGSMQTISRFLADSIYGAGVDKGPLLPLALSMSPGVDPSKLMTSSREERIKAFSEFVTRLDNWSHDPLAGQFIAGLLLAITGNGSFDLLRSSRELLSRAPVSIIWFGVCASLFGESNVLTTANCAGRRLLRDLKRPADLFDPPTSDLNSYEYRMLRRDPGGLEQVNSRSADSFEVELLASVTTRIPKYDTSRVARLTEDVEVLAGGLQEIRSVVERTQRRLRYITTPPRQSDMFASNAKPRGRPR
jgi:hypothetical protein